jgi:hypothetical protein
MDRKECLVYLISWEHYLTTLLQPTVTWLFAYNPFISVAIISLISCRHVVMGLTYDPTIDVLPFSIVMYNSTWTALVDYS